MPLPPLHAHTLNTPGPDLERVTNLLRLYETGLFTLILVLVGLLGVLLIVLTLSVARRLAGTAEAGFADDPDAASATPTPTTDAWTQAGRRVELEPREAPDDDDSWS